MAISGSSVVLIDVMLWGPFLGDLFFFLVLVIVWENWWCPSEDLTERLAEASPGRVNELVCSPGNQPSDLWCILVRAGNMCVCVCVVINNP